ncbi:MAG: porin [Nitrospinae bacterium]|nr:porin [Nitrospinota bacterium]
MFRRFLTIFLGAALLAAFQRPSAAASLDQLSKDVETLKKENEDLKERVKTIEVKDEEDSYSEKKRVNISGYADVEYDYSSVSSNPDHFRVRHLSLFFSQDVQKQWKLFSELEFEDAPLYNSTTTQGQILLEQMYIQYKPSAEFEVSAGRVLTPAGLWLIYHYPPYVETQQRPLHIRKIFPQYSDGLEVRRSFALGQSMLDVQAYVTNGTGNPGVNDADSTKGIGVRLNLSADLQKGKLEVGASYLSPDDTTHIYQNSYGLHLKATSGPLRLQSEYAARQSMNPNFANAYWDTGFYVQGAFDIKKWTLVARWDQYNGDGIYNGDGTLNLTNPVISDHRVYTAAVNYHLFHNVLTRFELHRHEFANPSQPNYYLGIASVILSLGDL